jgi:hypothetical protein
MCKTERGGYGSAVHASRGLRTGDDNISVRSYNTRHACGDEGHKVVALIADHYSVRRSCLPPT